MNQVFNFHRFGLLLKLDFAENGKKNILSLIVVIGLMLLLMAPVFDYRKIGFEPILSHMIAFCIALFCGSLFSNLAFEKYGSPTTGIATIMIPASQTEKFASALVSTTLFMGFLIGSFWIMHYEFSAVLVRKYPEIGNMPMSINNMFVFLYIFFLIHAVSFLGSIYFPKTAFIKTASIFFAFLTICFFVNSFMVNQMVSESTIVQGPPLAKWNVVRNGTYMQIEYSETTWLAVKTFGALFVLTLWYTAYARLKEKEI